MHRIRTRCLDAVIQTRSAAECSTPLDRSQFLPDPIGSRAHNLHRFAVRVSFCRGIRLARSSRVAAGWRLHRNSSTVCVMRFVYVITVAGPRRSTSTGSGGTSSFTRRCIRRRWVRRRSRLSHLARGSPTRERVYPEPGAQRAVVSVPGSPRARRGRRAAGRSGARRSGCRLC